MLSARFFRAQASLSKRIKLWICMVGSTNGWEPTYSIREHQWRQAFEETNRDWFCFVIENQNGGLVGFAKGKREKDASGNWSKIYLLKEYHGQGLGRLLLPPGG